MQYIIKKEGYPFAFDQSACAACNGACCRGESGYVWVGKEEIRKIVEYLEMEAEEFVATYLKKEGYRYSIKEIRSGGEYLCCFFEEGRGCTIYPVRPRQCRDFPFWHRYKDPKNLHEVCKECIGIVLS